MKAIHFYTDLTNEHQCSDYDLEDMLVDYTSFLNEYERNKDISNAILKTTQLCFLCDAWDYIKNGFNIFIHHKNSTMELTADGIKKFTNKEIKPTQNIEKLFMGGVFNFD